MRLRINRECEACLRLQRTRYQKDAITEDSVTAEIRADLDSFLGFVPAGASRWLDVGCGMALVDVALFQAVRARGVPRCTVYLMDRTRVDKDKRLVGYGAVDDFGFYSDFGRVEELLELNGAPKDSFVFLDAPEFPPDSERLDLVLSRISWCFHYPYEVYADAAHRALRPGGALIVDCRKGLESSLLYDARYAWRTCNSTAKFTTMCGTKL